MPYKIRKGDAETLLKELAAEFRKRNGRNADIEMVIVGGGSILLNYNFRGMTDVFDVTSTADRELKEASIKIRDKYDLEYNWINNDFMMTGSNALLLRQYSSPYKVLNNGHFEIRTIRAEYLIAMKAVACREYKSDRSDIIGILKEEKEAGNDITYKKINDAIVKLYGSVSRVEQSLLEMIKDWSSYSVEELDSLYNTIVSEETEIASEVRKEAVSEEHGLSEAKIEDVVAQIKANLGIAPQPDHEPQEEKIVRRRR